MQQCNAWLQLRDRTSLQVITAAAPFFEGPVCESGADDLKRTYGVLSVCLILEVRLTCFEPLLAGYLLAACFWDRDEGFVCASTCLRFTPCFLLEMGLTCFEPFEVRLASYEPKTYFFSRLCPFTSSHARIHRSTSPPPYIYTSVSHLRIHTVTPSRPPFLSLFLYIFSTVLDNHMSRSRATRRLVLNS